MRSIDTLRDDTQVPIELPVIDVANTSPENGKRLVDAAIRYGFLYISPNGTLFTEALVESLFELSKTFFATATSEKEDYQIGNDNRGFSRMHNEILDPAKQSKEFKEAFNIGEFDGNSNPQQRMPACFASNSGLQQLGNFEKACRETCRQVLDLICIGLEIEGGNDWFSRRHNKPSGCTMRMLHYPALPEDTDCSPDSDVRAGAHSDYGSITLLFQRPSQPGLEIRPPNHSDTWAPVPVFPPNFPSTTFPPILVNIGDLMSYWTNGLLRSTVHRVIFPKDTKAGEDRYSLVFFCHPSDDVELVAVPSQIVKEHKEKLCVQNGTEVGSEEQHGYGGGMTGERAMTAKEHLLKRLRATYKHRIAQET